MKKEMERKKRSGGVDGSGRGDRRRRRQQVTKPGAKKRERKCEKQTGGTPDRREVRFRLSRLM